jgi:hypothetical protein
MSGGSGGIPQRTVTLPAVEYVPDVHVLLVLPLNAMLELVFDNHTSM